MMSASFANADGLTAAASRPGPGVENTEAAKIDISGRWSGRHYGDGLPASAQKDCGGRPCALTYDIVACGDGWCGIAVGDNDACGAIGLRLGGMKKEANRLPSFDGKLELAKGSAAFVVKAWYRHAIVAPKEGETAGPAFLSLVGDTGRELLLMRRSFPLHATMSRIGDAHCTLEKATS